MKFLLNANISMKRDAYEIQISDKKKGISKIEDFSFSDLNKKKEEINEK